MLSLTFKGQTKSDKLTEKLRPSKGFKKNTRINTPNPEKEKLMLHIASRL